MRSRVEIVARAAAGRTALVRMHAEGQLAVRATGTGQVHLVGTAAGPLNGDEIEITVRVGAGARLVVKGVAATLALPGRSGVPAVVTTTLDVEDGGSLTYAPSPLVVCRAARLRTITSLRLTAQAQADVAEQVVLGRHGELGGEWSGRMSAERDGQALLRTAQDSALLATATVPPDARPARALVTRLLTSAPPGTGDTRGGAVCCPLAAGGVLVTALGPDLTSALADAAAVVPPGIAVCALHAAG